MTRETLSEYIGEDAVVLEPEMYDEAIVGVDQDGRVIYSFDKLIQVLTSNDDMTEEDAVDWIDFNIVRSIPYWGKMHPIMFYNIPDNGTE